MELNKIEIDLRDIIFIIAIAIVIVLSSFAIHKNTVSCGTDTCYYHNLTKYQEFCKSYYNFSNITLTTDNGLGGMFYADYYGNLYRCSK